MLIFSVSGGMHKCFVSDSGTKGKKKIKCTVLGIHGLYQNSSQSL